VYALLLNDMREPNIENIQVVRTAPTTEELAAWYAEQMTERWADGRWGKQFRAGSDLEWFNPASDLTKLNEWWGGIWECPDWVQVGHMLTKS
jgi:hypothetical protein